MRHTHVALAYYYIIEVEDPLAEVKNHKDYFKNRDIKGRIYLSKEGINGQISVHIDELKAFEEWMAKHPLFSQVVLKKHFLNEHIFDRMTVKHRNQLVAVDHPIDFSKTAEHVSPDKWKEMMENRDENTLVLDVRNDYEGKIGHFKDAHIPPCKSFRDFPAYIQELKNKFDPKKTKVMMYCTGGIRCEFFSPLMKEQGFDKLYQLEGGVIDYGLKQGDEYWDGKLFVFDDRLAVTLGEKEPIASCHHCKSANDRYINCANMDCNILFICCDDCLKEHKGCCSDQCFENGRVRKLPKEKNPKPFRKLPFEEKKKLKT